MPFALLDLRTYDSINAQFVRACVRVTHVYLRHWNMKDIFDEYFTDKLNFILQIIYRIYIFREVFYTFLQ